ncbi:MAG TPA: hypothetical protein VG322_06945 [Candidatus Acidoferrales bacterium]|jgi:hypothetical protein|nr:hypothetical protein [Candidatus Acidoferrales bacterium]
MEKTEPRFDIFSGHIDKNALWIETVEGLSNARERMEQIATEKPGQYFIFSPMSHAVLAQIETFASASNSNSQSNSNFRVTGPNTGLGSRSTRLCAFSRKGRRPLTFWRTLEYRFLNPRRLIGICMSGPFPVSP